MGITNLHYCHDKNKLFPLLNKFSGQLSIPILDPFDSLIFSSTRLKYFLNPSSKETISMLEKK